MGQGSAASRYVAVARLQLHNGRNLDYAENARSETVSWLQVESSAVDERLR